VDNGNPQGAPLTALLARYPCDTSVTLWPFRHLCAAVAEAVWMMCAWISHFCHAPINGPKLKTRELHMYVYRIPRDLPRLNATNMQAAGNAPPAIDSVPRRNSKSKCAGLRRCIRWPRISHAHVLQCPAQNWKTLNTSASDISLPRG